MTAALPAPCLCGVGLSFSGGAPSRSLVVEIRGPWRVGGGASEGDGGREVRAKKKKKKRKNETQNGHEETGLEPRPSGPWSSIKPLDQSPRPRIRWNR